MVSERATHGFKCGYWAAQKAHFDGAAAPSNPHQAGTFAHYDWSEGASAFAAEQRASARIAERNRR